MSEPTEIVEPCEVSTQAELSEGCLAEKLGIRGDAAEKKITFIEWMIPQIERIKEELPYLSIIPTSLIIAQAALESDWGRSYRAKKHFNLFGLEIDGQSMRFQSPQESLVCYLKTLYTNRSYRTFQSYLGIKSAPELTKHLVAYSKEKQEYGKKLRTIMRGNRLTKLDS